MMLFFRNRWCNIRIRRFLGLFFLFTVPSLLTAWPLYSPTWGFSLDLPEGYIYAEGNDVDRYSFNGPNDAKFDIAVYENVYSDIEEMAKDINRRLGNTGDSAFFTYNDRDAVLIVLDFIGYAGWGLCVELGARMGENPPMMVALAYSPVEIEDMDFFHFSAINSIAPTYAEMYMPGPIMEFGYLRGDMEEIPITGTTLTALMCENDAEAAQALVDIEYLLLIRYKDSEYWKEAWIRFYRMIYRDSWDRIKDAAIKLVRYWDAGIYSEAGKRAFAGKALSWVQNFDYERNLEGSDFVNLVSSITEGKGDCDCRSMLWAIILTHADIPAAMMVSEEHNHAMGLADIAGSGARFQAEGISWLVAETTATIDIGLIDQEMSNSDAWLGIIFYLPE
ncbi:MAG: hypothetical protein FWH41_10700 [Treponema sp.]|nr:hypothetical protein [Treponema sp.]